MLFHQFYFYHYSLLILYTSFQFLFLLIKFETPLQLTSPLTPSHPPFQCPMAGHTCSVCPHRFASLCLFLVIIEVCNKSLQQVDQVNQLPQLRVGRGSLHAERTTVNIELGLVIHTNAWRQTQQTNMHTHMHTQFFPNWQCRVIFWENKISSFMVWATTERSSSCWLSVRIVMEVLKLSIPPNCRVDSTS